MAAPLRSLTPISFPLFRCPNQYFPHPPKRGRSISSTTPRKAKQLVPQRVKDVMQRAEKRQSRAVQMKNMNIDKVPDDVGLIPQTFIRPSNEGMPGLFGSTWRSRLVLEWIWLKTRIQNFSSLIYFLYFRDRKVPRQLRMPLDLRMRPSIALDLHKKFYTHLASGEFNSLRPILCDGLATQIRSQIAHREENRTPIQSWTLARYTSPLTIPFSFLPWPLTSILPFSQAKIVSDRVVPFPVGKDVHLRQCVVRIRSLQSLDKRDGSPPVEANLTEYLVMQRMKMEGKVEDWKIWGTTKASSQEQIAQMIDADGEGVRRITMMDRLRQADPTKGF